MDHQYTKNQFLEIRRAAADAYHETAKQLEAVGQTEAAALGYEAAAALDFQDEELQASWGGPFNGQRERQNLFVEILAKIAPIAILETGTYRATTTVFMAENFSGPIYTCEANRRFYLQSKKKLSAYNNVRIVESDSRLFLASILKELPQNSVIFVYLDAHWEEDLPLREEVTIILASGHAAVIMIDDFHVPFDAGYAFDDYGPEKILNLELLAFLRDESVRIFFPSTSSEHETGARRGCTVLSFDKKLTGELEKIEGLRSGDWRDWALVAAEFNARQMQKTADECVSLYRSMEVRFQECEADRTIRLENIASLNGMLRESEEDRAARAAQIDTLTDALQKSEEDRAARAVQIDTLTNALHKSEEDRAARAVQIDTLTNALHKSEEDRAARAVQIDTLTDALQKSEEDRAARAAQIDTLTDALKKSEEDRVKTAETLVKLQTLLGNLRTQKGFRLLSRWIDKELVKDL